MKGRYAVVMDTGPLGRPVIVFWQRAFGDIYLFETRVEAYEVFRRQCKIDDFSGPTGRFKYWVVDLSEEGAHHHGKAEEKPS